MLAAPHRKGCSPADHHRPGRRRRHPRRAAAGRDRARGHRTRDPRQDRTRVARETARLVTSSVILGGARTPMGRLHGALKDFSGAQLGGIAIKGALAKAGVGPEQVEYVIMGQVLTAGAGQIPARQAAVAAGIPMAVPAVTINKVCLSGIYAMSLADQFIRTGAFEIVVAGGQESMTQAP